MKQNLDIQELSIVLAVRNHNPAMLNPDFLNGSGVIPPNWELARPPVLTSASTQIVFKNGVNIVAQSGSIAFSQVKNSKDPLNLPISQVASKYAAMLPNLDYRAVGINPKRFVTFGDRPDAAHKYITETILSRGAWQDIGDVPMEAGVNLVYRINGALLRLSINEARLQLPEGKAIPAVVFAGNFHHELVHADRLSELQRHIENWQSDWHVYQDILNQKFLNQTPFELVLPLGNAS